MNRWSLRDILFLAVALILAGLLVHQVPMAVDEEMAIKDREIKRIRLEIAKEVVRRIEEESREMVNKARREKDGPTHRR